MDKEYQQLWDDSQVTAAGLRRIALRYKHGKATADDDFALMQGTAGTDVLSELDAGRELAAHVIQLFGDDPNPSLAIRALLNRARAIKTQIV